jgi:four helix bundle protein
MRVPKSGFRVPGSELRVPGSELVKFEHKIERHRMGTITRFEDIVAWQKARQLTKAIYEATSRGEFSRDFGLREQIRKAGVSSMSNIAESFEREGNKEFVQFLTVSKGSTAEVKSQLYVALDARFITQPEFTGLYQIADDTSRVIGGFMRYLQTSGLRGRKFNQ